MLPLPAADAATKSALLRWLDVFAGHVRAVDYAAAAPLFHPEVIAFGTHRDVIPGLDAWIRTQWDNVWPRTDDFRFDLDGTHVLASADGSIAIAVAPWASTGFDRDGTRFERPGRATMVFRRDGERWICVHSHMSLNRGVPQESHGDRPVKAWP
ncbi:MAG TPA: nuclear transport factor 2 family protein [Acetobacteraceae bacterium]|jgi:ketosteroid isomerase-like protein|nr:nuclear transport factor 2 family protein [Acetobacteraceae bacterium]